MPHSPGLRTLTGAGERYLRRHQCGDWGDLDPDDWAANDMSLREGTRITSSYRLPTDEKLWIITKWDRSVATLLLPSDD